MKRLYLLILGLSVQILSIAQRMRAMPDDYMDYDDYVSSNSNESAIVPFSFLVIMAVCAIWLKIALKISRNKEIRKKTYFLTDSVIFGCVKSEMLSNNYTKSYPKDYFVDLKGNIKIPKYARCIILEYYSQNRSYVKVKFEDYSEPLYIGRWMVFENSRTIK